MSAPENNPSFVGLCVVIALEEGSLITSSCCRVFVKQFFCHLSMLSDVQYNVHLQTMGPVLGSISLCSTLGCSGMNLQIVKCSLLQIHVKVMVESAEFYLLG